MGAECAEAGDSETRNPDRQKQDLRSLHLLLWLSLREGFHYRRLAVERWLPSCFVRSRPQPPALVRSTDHVEEHDQAHMPARANVRGASACGARLPSRLPSPCHKFGTAFR